MNAALIIGILIPVVCAVGAIYWGIKAQNWQALVAGTVGGIVVCLIAGPMAQSAVAIAESVNGYSLTTSNSTIATTNRVAGLDSLDVSWQQKTFYSNGRYYVVYGDPENVVDNFNMLYRSSQDGVTWTAPAVLFSTMLRTEDRYVLWPTGNKLYCTYSGKVSNAKNSSFSISTLNADGTITPGAWSNIAVGDDCEDYNSGGLMDNQTFLMTFMNFSDSRKMYAYVGNVSTGSWVNVAGSPFKVTNIAAPAFPSGLFATTVPLTAGKAYVFVKNPSVGDLYGVLWNGTAFAAPELILNHTMSSGNTVASGLMTDGRIMVATLVSGAWQYAFRSTSGTWGAWAALSAPTASSGWAVLSTSTIRNEAHLLYEDNETTHRYVKALRFRDGRWDASPTTIVDAGASVISRPTPAQARYERNIGLGYVLGSGVPYTVKYAAITVNGG